MSTEDILNDELDSISEDEAVETTGDSKEFEVPKKFAGKSLEDVVHAYTELEKQFGRQANEFGQLRKMTDQFLFNQMESNKQKSEPQDDVSVDFDDFVEDPRSAVDKLVSPKLKQVEDKLAEWEKKERFAEFTSKHSDFQQHLADAAFQEWVSASPHRVRLFQKADGYDAEAADELFSTWKERQELIAANREEAREEKENKRKEALKKASTESSSTGASSRKIFRRVDIIEMRANEPSKYERLLPEIKKAYAEGRVK
jgi:hypothetical protein